MSFWLSERFCISWAACPTGDFCTRDRKRLSLHHPPFPLTPDYDRDCDGDERVNMLFKNTANKATDPKRQLKSSAELRRGGRRKVWALMRNNYSICSNYELMPRGRRRPPPRILTTLHWCTVHCTSSGESVHLIQVCWGRRGGGVRGDTGKYFKPYDIYLYLKKHTCWYK